MDDNTLHNELEGLHFDILNDYIEKGKTNDMPAELIEYMEQLNFIQSRLNRAQSPSNVKKSLLAFFPSLEGNIRKAQSRFDDALQFFHINKDDNKQAWRNVLFELGYKAYELFIRTTKDPKELLKSIDSLEKLYKIKGLHLPDEDLIDQRLLEEKIEIFSLTPGDVGLPEANRHALAAQIDQMPLQEEQKLRLKMDAGVKPRQILDWNNEQSED